MVTQSQVPKHHLNPINTHWHNRSLSSLSATSDAATFHSAHAHLSNMELRQLSVTQPHHSSVLTSLPLSNTTQPLPSPKLTAIKMNRQDSGYAESHSHSNSTPHSPTSTSHSRRISTSSSVKRKNSPSTHQNTSSTSRPKKRTTNSSSSSTRPSTKRTTTQVRTSNPGSRPSLSSRHTTPYAHSQISQQPYQFFQFPSLTDSSPPQTTSTSIHPNSPSSNPTTMSPPPPPATIQYWTSDSTRRLEYAAIDAASKGVRGFFIKLLPDCILPVSSRRTKFHCEDDDGASDAGSVRRYRLVLPEEKQCCGRGDPVTGKDEGKSSGRRGLLRRWTSFGKKSGRMD